MITKKIIALLLGISALYCSDATAKSRVESFLTKPNLKEAFSALSDTERDQLAKDSDESFDQIKGVAMLAKKPILIGLCDEHKRKKQLASVTIGQKTHAYLGAAAQQHPVASPQKDVGKLGGRTHSPVTGGDQLVKKTPILVPSSIADKLVFFTQQTKQLQKQVTAKSKGKAVNPRLLELKAELDGLNEPLEKARSASDIAIKVKHESEELKRRAAEDEMKAIEVERQAADAEKMEKENEEKSRNINESIGAMVIAYELNRSEVDALSNDHEIKQKNKQY